MDYTRLINELEKSDLFDLYRLYVAIGHELNAGQKLNQVKQQLVIGMDLSYFSSKENRPIKCKLLKVKSKSAVVLDYELKRQLAVPYYTLNINNADTQVYQRNSKESLTANNLSVGEFVGFHKDGQIIIGMIKRLNTKSVTLRTQIGSQWRVAYSFLFRIHDVDQHIITIDSTCQQLE